MRHARPDYDRIQDPAGLIPAEEPVFLIRGQDPVGALAVRAYADLHETNGGDAAVAELARQHSASMDAWPVKKEHADLPPYAAVPLLDGSELVPEFFISEGGSFRQATREELVRATRHLHIPTPDFTLVMEVLHEKRRAQAKWGGQRHDDEHMSRDWTAFITHYIGVAVRGEGRMWDFSPAIFRRCMVKIAGLAMNAIQWCDRNYVQTPPGVEIGVGLASGPDRSTEVIFHSTPDRGIVVEERKARTFDPLDD